MADNLTREKRHMVMAGIRSRNTAPETMVARFLHAHGLRFRRNVVSLPGRPDLALRKYRTVVFVNGCFWHKHDCGRFRMPGTNTEYWAAKIERNVARDRDNVVKLQIMGWKVVVVWECQLKGRKAQATLEELFLAIAGSPAEEPGD